VKRGGVVTLFCTAKNVTKKNNRRVEVWNKPKDNRRPARQEGRGFWFVRKEQYILWCVFLLSVVQWQNEKTMTENLMQQ
jgi:hypothetical protein